MLRRRLPPCICERRGFGCRCVPCWCSWLFPSNTTISGIADRGAAAKSSSRSRPCKRQRPSRTGLAETFAIGPICGRTTLPVGDELILGDMHHHGDLGIIMRQASCGVERERVRLAGRSTSLDAGIDPRTHQCQRRREDMARMPSTREWVGRPQISLPRPSPP